VTADQPTIPLTDPETSPARRALIALAGEGLQSRVGDRLATGQDYQELVGVGSGTVRKALAELARLGALGTRTRGHQGTVITSRNPGLLWELSGRRPLRFAVPPAGALDQMGAALAVVDELGEAGLYVVTTYVRAARRRLSVLLAGDTDLVLMSRQASMSLTTQTADQVVVRELTGIHYYDPDLLQVVEKPEMRQPSIRVGIDPESQDHAAITDVVFSRTEFTYVEVPFPLIPRRILEGVIDTGVWHRVNTLIPPETAGLGVRPLSAAERSELPANLFSAAVAWRRDDPAMTRLAEDFTLSAMNQSQQRILTDFHHDESDPHNTFMC
jgi:hypothetical protein